MKLLIAGGGTGGHLYPGIAIADAFLKKDPGNQVLFVGTKGGLEARVLPKKNYSLEFISISGWARESVLKKIKTLLLIPISMVQSFLILLRYKPDIVLGIGGYASFPMLVSAFLLHPKKKKRAIQEQNIEPGLTNRLLAYVVNRIFVSFEESQRYFPAHKVLATGNPIRAFGKNVPSSVIPAHPPRDIGILFTLFIFGGSQGAHSLNRAFLEALSFLLDIKDKIHIIHQTGTTDLNWVESTYFQNQWKGEVYDFIDDIESIYAKADYVICRAGATSLAELSFLKKASLLIPYPYAAHQHQEKNARLLESYGAARVLLDWQLDGPQLAKEIKWAFNHPRELEEMRKKIVQFSRPYAAEAIANDLTQRSF